MKVKGIWDWFLGQLVSYYYFSRVGESPCGTLLFADQKHHRVLSRDGSGKTTVLSGGNMGYRDGPGAAVRFNGPVLLGVDGQGYCYVNDTGNGCLRRVSPVGDTVTLRGQWAALPSVLNYSYMEWYYWEGDVFIVNRYGQIPEGDVF
jgi:hypothetical protein